MSEIAEAMAVAWDEGWTARFEMDTYGGHKHNPYSCGLCKEAEAQPCRMCGAHPANGCGYACEQFEQQEAAK